MSQKISPSDSHHRSTGWHISGLSYKNVSSGKTLASAFGRAHSPATFVGGHILWECVFPVFPFHWNVSWGRIPTKDNISSRRCQLVSSGKTHFYRREPRRWVGLTSNWDVPWNLPSCSASSTNFPSAQAETDREWNILNQSSWQILPLQSKICVRGGGSAPFPIQVSSLSAWNQSHERKG